MDCSRGLLPLGRVEGKKIPAGKNVPAYIQGGLSLDLDQLAVPVQFVQFPGHIGPVHTQFVGDITGVNPFGLGRRKIQHLKRVLLDDFQNFFLSFCTRSGIHVAPPW